MLFQIDALKSSANFTGKHLCCSLFLKNFQAERLKKVSNTGVFLWSLQNFSELFFNRTPPLTASAPPVAVSVFLLKKWLNSYFTTFLWDTNNFFFSTHRLMYKKLNSFVHKFVINFQVFKITLSGCNLWSWKLVCLITWTYSKHRFLNICWSAFNGLS